MNTAILSESSLSLLHKTEDRCSETDGASTAEPETPCSASSIESVASVSVTVENTVVLHNVSHACPGTDKRMLDLIRQTRELSELAFDEDALAHATKKSHWKLSLLATKDLSVLCAFALTKITNGALSIAKIAVPVEFRGLGFGKALMEDAIKAAKKGGEVYEVALSSLSTAVSFYKRLGFKAMTAVKVKTDFEVVEGQVYMVKKLRPRPKGK